MDFLSSIEECYKRFSSDIAKWVPEGVFVVDLQLLNRFNLLYSSFNQQEDPSLTRYFQVIESPEKITLINEQFVVWIIPDKSHGVSTTYTLVALNKPSINQLEVAFVASGVYNTSRLVLRTLEKFLQEIQETEEELAKLQASS